MQSLRPLLLNATRTRIAPTLRLPLRSIVVPASYSTVSDAIKHDHAELKEYYSKILNASEDDHDTKTRYQNQFTWELARHSIAEELVVYPAMEKYIEGGKDIADHDRGEHRTLKEELKKFQNLKSSSTEFTPTLQKMIDDLDHHIAEEEKDDLPKLEKALPEGESEKLASSFQRTKMFTPTRSHPSSPDRPPFETVMGLMVAPMDKLADMFRKFPQESGSSSSASSTSSTSDTTHTATTDAPDFSKTDSQGRVR